MVGRSTCSNTANNTNHPNKTAYEVTQQLDITLPNLLTQLVQALRGGNQLNPMLAIEGNPNPGNNRNRVQGRAFTLGIAEAPQDPNIMTVQILLANEENLEVHRERPKRNLKQLKTMKVNELKHKDIPVARNFPGVFSKDLSGLPPSRDVEFLIDLIPGAMPVAKSPYRLAPTKMQELSNQFKEL
nr:putative reverse transcriptase domain-containing protein [Tanacetum cinerariifolium]